MTTVYFITHPDVVMDPSVPIQRWALSKQGRARIADALDASLADAAPGGDVAVVSHGGGALLLCRLASRALLHGWRCIDP